MTNIYVIDTSSLIVLMDYYPTSVFPTLWMKIESMINEDMLIAPMKVFDEIKQKVDKLKIWSEGHEVMFKPETIEQALLVKQILDADPKFRSTRKHNADPWIIALGIVTKTQRVDVSDARIITQEKYQGHKIPIIAKKHNIKSLSLQAMFVAEKWKF